MKNCKNCKNRTYADFPIWELESAMVNISVWLLSDMSEEKRCELQASYEAAQAEYNRRKQKI